MNTVRYILDILALGIVAMTVRNWWIGLLEKD
jgi:hypothetical protein